MKRKLPADVRTVGIECYKRTWDYRGSSVSRYTVLHRVTSSWDHELVRTIVWKYNSDRISPLIGLKERYPRMWVKEAETFTHPQPDLTVPGTTTVSKLEVVLMCGSMPPGVR